jgi:hypothetical protein
LPSLVLKTPAALPLANAIVWFSGGDGRGARRLQGLAMGQVRTTRGAKADPRWASVLRHQGELLARGAAGRASFRHGGLAIPELATAQAAPHDLQGSGAVGRIDPLGRR